MTPKLWRNLQLKGPWPTVEELDNVDNSTPAVTGNALVFDGVNWKPGSGVDMAVILSPASSTRNLIQPTGDYVPLAIKGHSSQTANLLELKNSSGTIVSGADRYGRLFSDPINNSNFLVGGSGSPTMTGTQNVGLLSSLINVTSGRFNMAIGSQTCNGVTTMDSNVAVGTEAIKLSNYDGRVGIGYQASMGTQGFTTGVGYGALRTSGANTVGIGVFAGYNSGDNSVFIGPYAGFSETNSNRLYISNSTTSTPLIYGVFTGATAGLTFYSQNLLGVPLTVQGIASQSANLFDLKNSSGNVLSSFTKDGLLGINMQPISRQLSIKGTSSWAGIALHRYASQSSNNDVGLFDFFNGPDQTNWIGELEVISANNQANSGDFVFWLADSGSLQQRVTFRYNGNVGIGTTTPTAYLHLKAGTSNTAPLKLTAGPLLTTPEEGAVEYKNHTFYMTTYLVRRSVVLAQEVPITDTTVANTTTETTVYTIPMAANYLTPGKMLDIAIHGIFSSVAGPNGVCTIRIKCAGITLATFATVAQANTNTPYRIEIEATCRAIGASGSIISFGEYTEGTTNTAETVTRYSGATATLDTTTDNTLTVTMQWATANASNTLTQQQARTVCVDANT